MRLEIQHYGITKQHELQAYDTWGIHILFRENHVKEEQCGDGESGGEERSEYRLCGG